MSFISFSGVVGSGLCVFSKYRIESAFYHSWRLNGYVHRIQHGDWFGGKGVGLVKVNVHGHTVNFYVAHVSFYNINVCTMKLNPLVFQLHAEYNRVLDDYLTHRIIQAFDTAQFIENTRGNSILQILAGDLNNEPGDLGYRIIISTSGLQDSYDQKLLNGTNECAKNTYSIPSEAEKCPEGKRIDYILVRSSDAYKVQSIEYTQPLPDRVPDHSFSYSDHEAVQAKIKVSPVTTEADEKAVQDKLDCQEDDKKVTLSESIKLCDQSLSELNSYRKNYFMIAMAIIVVLLNLIEVQAPYGLKTFFVIVKVLIAAVLIFFLFMATIWHGMERHAILSGKLSMEILLSSIEKVGNEGDGNW